MRGGHGHEWREHEDDDVPLARPSFAARLIAPVNRLFRGTLGRVVRWVAGTVAVLVLCIVGIYVAFLTGLLSADMATPWIVSALEEKLPPGHKVIIGRTRLDYDSTGAPVLTAEKIEIRNDRNEEIVRAPAAEVGLEPGSLLMGNYRARRITLVGAVMTIRLDENGNIKVSTPKQAEAARPVVPDARRPRQTPPPAATADPLVFSEIANWLGRLERTGIDGIALSEVGLDRGTLIVESDTQGKSWKFTNINFSLRRPAVGGVTFRLTSGDGANPWELNASIGAPVDGVRMVDLIADRVVPNDIINAAGYGDMDIYASTPISALLRAQIGVDGKLVSSSFRIVAGRGEVGNARDERGRFQIDEAQLIVRFDAQRGLFVVDPLQIGGAQNRLILGAVIEPPKAGTNTWLFAVPQGALALATGRANEPRLSIDTVMFRGGYDTQSKRLTIDEGVLRGPTAGLALSGAVDFGGEDPMLQLGLVAEKMPLSALKRLWPAPVAPGTRTWVLENIEAGLVERAVIALNASIEALLKPGTVLPEDSMKIEMVGSGLKFTAVPNLPPISEARATILVTGQNARIKVTNGVVDLGRKRRLLTEGTFEVFEHFRTPPTGIVNLKIEGNGEAIADLLSRDILKSETGLTLNPDTTRGQVVSNVRIELPLKSEILRSEIRYAGEADFTGFSADNIVKGQKIEQAAGKITISANQFFVKGEGRLGGAPSMFEYTKPRGKPDAEFRVAAILDEAARNRFGIELSPWLAGQVTVRAQGVTNEKESRINIDADLTAASINELVPGWNKAPGRAARAQYRLIERDGSYKLEDMNITGSGVNLRGSVEFDSEGAILGANFPTFHLTEGDRASLTVERNNDGSLRVSLRGTVLDARAMIRSLSDTPSPTKKKEKPRDVDLDVRIGAATGHNGEVIRNLELRVTRRNNEIRSFALLGRVGRDSTMVGELRARDGGRPVIYITSGDGGALFRFADYYSKIQGGEIWIVLDTPTSDNSPQEGIVSVRSFNIVGEPNLDRLQSSAPVPSDGTPAQRNQLRGGSVPFVRMRIDFTRTPGRFTIKEALIFGPTIGATVDGVLDYANNSVQIRGTYVPAYGLNNFFGQIPLVGLFLGGPKEGLLALTFEIVGPASAPTLRVNPMSMAAPGFFRKIFEFRGMNDAPAPLSPR